MSPANLIRRVDGWLGDDGSHPDILLLGDSVTERVSRLDSDKRCLGEMIRESLGPRLRADYLSFSGCHPRAYLAVLRLVLSYHRRPELVVVPINVRSFSPQWHANPKWQYRTEVAAIEAFARDRKAADPLAEAGASPDEENEFRELPLSIFGTSLDKVGPVVDLIERKLRGGDERGRRAVIFAFHYLNHLVPSHPHLDALREMRDLASSAAVGLLFYFTPINWEAGVALHGDQFNEIVAGNRNVIRAALGQDRGAAVSPPKVSDLLFTLPAREFFSDLEPTEHLNQAGRLHLASLLGGAIDEVMESRMNNEG